ncbi:uncharacterized protein EURHEDRAFT_336734 [Aspergillus ruber CBS 135680]|uniref:Uncharacterized protein n=1 Tax=Aspergillus ruber (strain CBS 135680) TaxID=1388766 RepID=A0A017SIZ3_ASPRC|nr:uncharacterized protein EURHEDRAFT_336734 [Aspergillus ruber CBS 135680]EYE96726.1 hypothetical protein EURHEDRAFT_336734 [Aspergillus ruber CBS 135680]
MLGALLGLLAGVRSIEISRKLPLSRGSLRMGSYLIVFACHRCCSCLVSRYLCMCHVKKRSGRQSNATSRFSMRYPFVINLFQSASTI